MKENYVRLVGLTFIFLFCAIFIFLRYSSLHAETVPYTYDQGRDFLAAKKIIVDKDITLIGPTTGAQGVFHGAWWYYYLAIPFVLTYGSPIGFYYFIAATALISALALSWLVNKETHNQLLATVPIALITVSPYFMTLSVFAINSGMAVPFIVGFMVCLFSYLRTKKLIFLFGLAWCMGMIAESEVAFGLFLFPSVILASFIAGLKKEMFGSAKKIMAIAFGWGTSLILRIVFELKNNFLQTKALLHFSDGGGASQSWKGVFIDRLHLFQGYYLDIFPGNMHILGIAIALVAVYGYFRGHKKLDESQRKSFVFLAVMLVLMFALSLVHRSNSFWSNYFEGIHLFFIALLVGGLYSLYKSTSKNIIHYLTIAFLVILTAAGVSQSKVAYAENLHPENIGLRMHTEAISYLYAQVGKKEFCLKIYTPPVIPHTYNYLLDLASRTQGVAYPKPDFVNGECWYFIESDSYAQRRDDWVKSQIPSDAHKVMEHSISDNLVIQKWELPKVTH